MIPFALHLSDCRPHQLEISSSSKRTRLHFTVVSSLRVAICLFLTLKLRRRICSLCCGTSVSESGDWNSVISNVSVRPCEFVLWIRPRMLRCFFFSGSEPGASVWGTSFAFNLSLRRRFRLCWGTSGLVLTVLWATPIIHANPGAVGS